MRILLLIPLFFSILSHGWGQDLGPALDPSDIFFQAWLDIQEAKKATQKGEFDKAHSQYIKAAKYYAFLNKKFPHWKPHLVSSRIQSTRTALDLLKSQAQNSTKKKPSATFEHVDTTPLPQAPALPTPHTTPSPQSPLKASAKKIEQLQLLTLRLRKEIAAKTQVSESQKKEKRQLLTLLAKREKEIATLQNLLASAPLQKDLDNLIAQNGTRQQELVITARALKKTRLELEDAQEHLSVEQARANQFEQESARLRSLLESQQTTNNQTVSALKKEISALQSSLLQTRQSLGKARGKIAELSTQLTQSKELVAELTAEKNTLEKERDNLATLLGQKDNNRIDILITENMRLGRALKESEERLQFLEKRDDATKNEILEAKSDLAVAKMRILDYQRRDKERSMRLANLQKDLKEARATLLTAQQTPTPSPVSNEEVLTLKKTVQKLLAAQERRRIAEEILWKTYTDSYQSSPAMQSAFADLRKEEIVLSAFEENLVTQRKPDEEFSTPQRVSASHALAHAQALESELATYTPLVQRAFSKGHYQAARQILAEMDERYPGHFPTLCSRGVVELKTRHYDEAIAFFQEAVTMRDASSYAQHMLGLAHYKKGEWLDAKKHFELALSLSPNSPHTELYLGILAGRNALYNEAKAHFNRSLELDPTQSTAYYNLSVILLRTGDKQAARNAYDKSLENGGLPEPEHAAQLR